jgi:hypothetical protein
MATIFRWPAPLLIQDGRYGSHLGFRFCQLSHQRMGQLVRFGCGLLGVTGGRFLSMISADARSSWLLWHPSWIWFPSIIWQTPGSTDYLHLVGTHDIPQHPTLPFHLITNVTTYSSGAYVWLDLYMFIVRIEGMSGLVPEDVRWAHLHLRYWPINFCDELC